MNLDNLNLVELNTQEMKETEGGFLPLLVVYGCWGVMLVKMENFLLLRSHRGTFLRTLRVIYLNNFLMRSKQQLSITIIEQYDVRRISM